MNAIVRKLKLYRISTVLNYCRNSWDNSAFVIKQCPSKSRFSVFVDLLYWYTAVQRKNLRHDLN